MKSLFFILVFCCSVVWASKDSLCQGYQIVTDKNSLNSKIGIKVGDIIKSFDGVTVTSAAQSMEMYNKLDSIGKHEVTIERNGKTEKIKYELAQAYKSIP